MDTLPCLRIPEDPEAEVALDPKSLHILSLTTPDGKNRSLTNQSINQSLSYTYTQMHKHTHISFLQISLKISFLPKKRDSKRLSRDSKEAGTAPDPQNYVETFSVITMTNRHFWPLLSFTSSIQDKRCSCPAVCRAVCTTQSVPPRATVPRKSTAPVSPYLPVFPLFSQPPPLPPPPNSLFQQVSCGRRREMD